MSGRCVHSDGCLYCLAEAPLGRVSGHCSTWLIRRLAAKSCVTESAPDGSGPARIELQAASTGQHVIADCLASKLLKCCWMTVSGSRGPHSAGLLGPCGTLDNRHLTVVQDAAETVGGAGVAVAEHPGLSIVRPYCMPSARSCHYLSTSPDSMEVTRHHVRPVFALEIPARCSTVAGVVVTSDPAQLADPPYWSPSLFCGRRGCVVTRRSWALNGRRRRGGRRGTRRCSRDNPSRRAPRQEREIAQGPVTELAWR